MTNFNSFLFRPFKFARFWLINVSIILLLGSCGGKKYEEIPLDKLDNNLKERGYQIAKDILVSIELEEGANYLLKKEYMTPLVHGRIVGGHKMYKEAYFLLGLMIGKVKSYQLFQVLDKKLVKTLRFKLECESEDMKMVELKIDINGDGNLADFYIYLTSENGELKRVNALPYSVR